MFEVFIRLRLVYGCLNQVLKRLSNQGWRLNIGKCKFALTVIHFLGQIVTGQGIRADEDRTRAIAKMSDPMNDFEVRSLLGMINHYGKVIPHLHEIKQPLEDLTRKGVP